MQALQYLSIALELIIGIISLLSAVKGRKYMYGLAFTFFVYVLYDMSKFYSVAFLDGVLSILFFLATLSALVSILGIYKQK